MRAENRLVAWTFAINLGLLVGAGVVWYGTESRLVLAQGFDSMLDLCAGAILVYAARLSAQDRDDDHPFGHQKAEPIGALVTAVLAGVLAFEVMRDAIAGLASGSEARLDGTVAAILGAKLAIKLLILIKIERSPARGPALEATRIDTRNDLVASASSLVGFGLVQAGFGWADAALALPIGLYIGLNGFALARENLRYLMGEAPSAETLSELEQLVVDVRGVRSVRELRAAWRGPELVVAVAILAERDLTLTEGHDVSVEIQRRLEEHDQVGEVFVHVDPPDGGRPH